MTIAAIKTTLKVALCHSVLHHSVLFSAFAALFLIGTAQGADHVQSDYADYAKRFFEGQAPNFSVDSGWRSRYEKHDWKGAAEEGSIEAKTLTAIYLISFIDQQLTLQIQKIFLEKAMMDHGIAQSAVLDSIAMYMNAHPDAVRSLMGTGGAGVQFYTSETKALMQKTDNLVRQNMVSGVAIAKKTQGESREVQALFRQKESGIVADFLLMREKFKALEDLKYHFSANWNADRLEKTRKRLKENKGIEAIVALRMKQDGGRSGGNGIGRIHGGMTVPLPSPEIGGDVAGLDDEEATSSGGMGSISVEIGNAEIKKKVTDDVITEMLQQMKARYEAHKYLVGVYQGQDYHQDTLEQIYRYLNESSAAGNPVAQCYYALFMKWLGETIGVDSEGERNQAWNTLLNKVEKNKEAASWVREKLLPQAQRAETNAKKRAEIAEKRIRVLLDAEDEKIKTIDKMLLSAAGRAGNAPNTAVGRNDDGQAESAAMQEVIDADRVESMKGLEPK